MAKLIVEVPDTEEEAQKAYFDAIIGVTQILHGQESFQILMEGELSDHQIKQVKEQGGEILCRVKYGRNKHPTYKIKFP